jgi:hypothetical protein
MRYLQRISTGLDADCMAVMHTLTRQPELRVEESEHGFTWLRHDHEDTALMERIRVAKDLAKKLMYAVSAVRLGSMLISRLAVGAKIGRIRNHDTWFTPYRIILLSGPGSMFTAGDETVSMLTGEIWWYDPEIEISEINNSHDDRVHLAVDLRLDP